MAITMLWGVGFEIQDMGVSVPTEKNHRTIVKAQICHNRRICPVDYYYAGDEKDYRCAEGQGVAKHCSDYSWRCPGQ
jgi:hypothetical protein